MANGLVNITCTNCNVDHVADITEFSSTESPDYTIFQFFCNMCGYEGIYDISSILDDEVPRR